MVAVAVMTMIMIDETGIMDETVAGEEEGEGDGAVITEVGTIDHHTGRGIAMTVNRCLPDDICGAEEVDRGALHQGDLGAGEFHGGTTESGVLLVPTRADPQLQHSQL